MCYICVIDDYCMMMFVCLFFWWGGGVLASLFPWSQSQMQLGETLGIMTPWKAIDPPSCVSFENKKGCASV